MPVEYVPPPDGPGYRWGKSGRVYRYTSEEGRARAIARAAKQGRAIAARQADAYRWKIQERRAPSDRAYMRLVTKWVRDMGTAIVRAMLDEARKQADADLDPFGIDRALRAAMDLAASGRLPEPPTPQRLIEVTAGSTRQAIRNARRDLLTAGLGLDEIARRLQIEPTKLIGLDVAPTQAERATLEVWAQEGIDLIITIQERLLQGINKAVMQAARTGLRIEDFAQILRGRLGIEIRHARLIARDQTGKLNGRITEATQAAAGVTHYRWRSARDVRVRERHRELDGTVHAWTSPPPDAGPYGEPAHPGQAIQCRCVAIPIVD